VRMAPCPTLVVKGGDQQPHREPRRVLVPTNGSLAARRAAELGFVLLPSRDAEVVVLNVVQRMDNPHQFGRPRRLQREHDAAQAAVRDLARLGEAQGVRVVTEIRQGRAADDVILEVASNDGIDLIVLGTDVRPGSDRLFLGPRVERVLAGATCPVLVLNA